MLENASAGQTGHLRTPTERVAVPAPGPGFGPATPPGTYGAPTAQDRPREKRRKPYFAVVAGLAVCAVAIGAYLLTRPPLDEAASTTPTASSGSTADKGLDVDGDVGPKTWAALRSTT